MAKRYARTIGGVVTETWSPPTMGADYQHPEQADPEQGDHVRPNDWTPKDVFPDPENWIECGDEVRDGFAYADGKFSPPAPAVETREGRALRQQAMIGGANAVMARITEAAICGDTTMDAPDVIAFAKYARALRAADPEAPLPEAPAIPKGVQI